MQFVSQTTSVRSHARDTPMFVEEHCDPCIEDRDDMERESLSRPLANVSQDMCLVIASAKPQACPASSLAKCFADVVSPEEYSQAPTGGAQVAPSQQPPPEFLMSLGVKVRDFAYENTLPAIVPVPRVPRQMQPAPRALKRLQRDWDDEDPSDNLSPANPRSGQTESKKPRSLERRPTEPLQEPAVQHARALERIFVKRVCSIITSSPRRTLPAPPLTGPSVSPPTSPLTPPLSHLASQESEFVQTPPTFPFVMHVDNTSMVSASQLDSELQPLSLRPVLYTRLTLESRSPPRHSPAPNPPQGALPAPLLTPFLELPPPVKEPGASPRVRKGRGRGTISTTPPNRYQLRQRPTPSPCVSTFSRRSHQASSTASKSLPRRIRRAR